MNTNPMPFDFFPTHIDPVKFLKCQEARQICDLWVDGELMFTPKNMDEQELAASFVNDILGVTMWELQTGLSLNFNKEELLVYVSQDQHDRIWDMINHESVVGLIQFNGNQIRIRNQKEILQAAMDFCGAYYSGFTMASGVIVVADSVRGSIQSEEELEELVKSLSMEFRGHESNRTLN